MLWPCPRLPVGNGCSCVRHGSPEKQNQWDTQTCLSGETVIGAGSHVYGGRGVIQSKSTGPRTGSCGADYHGSPGAALQGQQDRPPITPVATVLCGRAAWPLAATQLHGLSEQCSPIYSPRRGATLPSVLPRLPLKSTRNTSLMTTDRKQYKF